MINSPQSARFGLEFTKMGPSVSPLNFFAKSPRSVLRDCGVQTNAPNLDVKNPTHMQEFQVSSEKNVSDCPNRVWDRLILSLAAERGLWPSPHSAASARRARAAEALQRVLGTVVLHIDSVAGAQSAVHTAKYPPFRKRSIIMFAFRSDGQGFKHHDPYYDDVLRCGRGCRMSVVLVPHNSGFR
ncbi:hypothetical protein C8R44DRAFT_861002, partial [Mycena epipterygia]